MIRSEDWIAEILKTLKFFGADTSPVSQNRYLINGQLFVFVPAQSSKKVSVKNAIVIHEDIFYTRKNQLIMRLKSQLGLNKTRIHGRQTKVGEITRTEAKTFVDQNHLMGFGGGKTCAGLLHGQTLVAVAVFSKIRYMKYEEPTYYSAELERYCSLPDTTVVGGLDKLIRFYTKNYKPDDLVTTVDLEWSAGKSYIGLGFEEVAFTEPLLFAVKLPEFERRLVLSEADLREGEYLVCNAGNLKLRKWIAGSPPSN